MYNIVVIIIIHEFHRDAGFERNFRSAVMFEVKTCNVVIDSFYVIRLYH